MRDATGSITLRPAGPGDEEFLIEVYASSREYEMSLVPWPGEQKVAFLTMQFAAQQQHYKSHYPDAKHDIILSDGSPVGRVYVAVKDEGIRILDITLLTRFRGKGIGTPLIEGLMNEARVAGKPLSIYVESFNRSISLFERLGFNRIKEDGVNVLLEWQAGA
jgi:ribosomal protein S18 acetylase RimI-like enzyme